MVLSGLALFSWLVSMFGLLAIEAWVPASLTLVARIALLLVAPLVSLLPTSLAIRPLAPLFTMSKAAAHADLVGKVCTVRTGTVTDKFGEAVLEDGGAGFVVRVRIATGETLARGEQAVIVGYDEARGVHGRADVRRRRGPRGRCEEAGPVKAARSAPRSGPEAPLARRRATY